MNFEKTDPKKLNMNISSVYHEYFEDIFAGLKRLIVEVSLCVISWLLLLAFLGVVSAILVPLFVVKHYIVYKLVKILRKDVLGPLDPYDEILAQDDYYGPSQSYPNLSQNVIVEGQLSLDKLKQAFTENILQAKDPNTGDLIYKKMSYIPVSFGGYKFWKKDESFDLNDHIIEKDDIMTKERFGEFMSGWIVQSYPKNKPLWQIRVHPYENNKTIVAMKIHHCICDGLTFQKLYSSLNGMQSETMGKNLKVTAGLSTWRKVKMILRTPYVFLTLWSSNILHSNSVIEKRSGTNVIQGWSRTETSLVKKVRKNMNAHFAAAGTAIFANAIKLYFQKSENQFRNESMNILLPLPWRTHPNDRMSNTWTGAFIKVPFGGQDRTQWLEEVKEEFYETITSGSPIFTRYCIPLLTLVPSFLLRRFLHSKYSGFSMSFTTVKSPENVRDDFLGHKITQFLPVYGMQWEKATMTCAAYDFKGITTFSFLANEGIFKTKEEFRMFTDMYFPRALHELMTKEKEINGNETDRRNIKSIVEPSFNEKKVR